MRSSESLSLELHSDLGRNQYQTSGVGVGKGVLVLRMRVTCSVTVKHSSNTPSFAAHGILRALRETARPLLFRI